MFRLINKLKNRKGFTLIELIVVLAVLAVIVAIAIPRFMGVQEQAEKDADYSTGAMIAKAAELYAVQSDIAPGNITASALDISDIEFKSDFFRDKGIVDETDITITLDSDGDITIEGTDTATTDIYPEP